MARNTFEISDYAIGIVKPERTQSGAPSLSKTVEYYLANPVKDVADKTFETAPVPPKSNTFLYVIIGIVAAKYFKVF